MTLSLFLTHKNKKVLVKSALYVILFIIISITLPGNQSTYIGGRFTEDHNENSSVSSGYSNRDSCVSGIVNRYFKVEYISCTRDTLRLAGSIFLSEEDRVLVVQMKGAELETNLNASFGSIKNLNGAGNYELNTIESISGQIVKLSSPLSNSYDVSKAVQLIYVPVFEDVSVCDITCMQWNGTIGGIIAIEANGTISQEGDIDASGKGFSGGSRSNNFYDFSCDFEAYSTNSNSYASKGEGISTQFQLSSYGRGRNGNGGGGANPVNSGGGGGGSFGPGGRGGDAWVDCYHVSSGYGHGGTGLSDYIRQNRIFLGGGGGGGQQNDNLRGSGGSGGGIAEFIIHESQRKTSIEFYQDRFFN